MRFCLLASLFFLSTAGYTEPFDIKGISIEVPGPPYFVRVTDALLNDSPELKKALSGLKDAHLGCYINRNDIARLKTDANSEMSPNFILDTPPLPDNANVGAAFFALITKTLQAQNEQKMEYAKRLIPDAKDDYWKTGFPKEFPLEKAISVLDDVPLRAHLNTDRIYSYSSYASTNDGDGKVSEDDREIILATIAYVRVSQRVLTLLFLISPYENERSTLELSQKCIEEWAKLIIQANSGTNEEGKE